ncbi:MAG: hypothetical protein ACUVQZ_05985, partial [Candidatus Caldatribacteriaceae bacterium]
GTAMLGGRAIGVFSDFQEAIEAMVKESERFTPSALASSYLSRYAIYRKIYEHIRALNWEISKLV